MKIAFIVEHLDPNRGGLERSAVDFLTELAALGPEIHVVTQSGEWEHPGIQVHRLGVTGWTYEAQYREFVGRAQRFLADRSWDVVHAVRPCLSCDVYQPRGGIVEEKALYEALQQKKIAAAALDVIAEEPPAKDHPLFKLDNVLWTPHVGALTLEATVRGEWGAAEEIIRVLERKRPKNPVVDADEARLLLPA